MRTRSSSDDEITQADIDAIVADMYKLAMPPGEEIIHVIPQEYIVDNEIGIKNPSECRVCVWKRTATSLPGR